MEGRARSRSSRDCSTSSAADALARRVEDALARAGFGRVLTLPLEEQRRAYDGRAEVRADLMARAGRSILHELDDTGLAFLADHVTAALPESGVILETAPWTVWAATR